MLLGTCVVVAVAVRTLHTKSAVQASAGSGAASARRVVAEPSVKAAAPSGATEFSTGVDQTVLPAVNTRANARAYYEKGMSLLKMARTPVEFRSAFDVLQRAADAGDPDALYQVARMLEAGQGTVRDIRRALKAYLASAQAGSVFGQLRAAQMLEQGLGTENDYVLAAFWYEKAAANGSGRALVGLGNLAALGHGSPQDHSRALDFYRKGAVAGDPDGLTMLALAKLYGLGIERDVAAAITELDAALSGGSAKAGLALASLYATENNLVARNNSAALSALQNAVATGDLDAKVQLARKLVTGELGITDTSEAIFLLGEAAKDGNPQAYIDLGKALLTDEISVERMKAAVALSAAGIAAGKTEAALLAAQLAAVTHAPEAVQEEITNKLFSIAEDNSDWRANYLKSLLEQGEAFEGAVKKVTFATDKDYIDYSLNRAVPNGMVAPKIVESYPVVLPTTFSVQGLTGATFVEFTINTQGLAENISVTSTSSVAVTTVVRDTFARWKFEPAQQAGKAVPTRVRIPVMSPGGG